MKKILFALLTSCVTCLSATNFWLILTWDKSPEPEVTGYRVYHSTNGNTFLAIAEVPNTGSMIYSNKFAGSKTGLRNYFQLTAFTAENLESDPSDTVFAVLTNTPPGKPTGFRIQSVLQASANAVDWISVTNFPAYIANDVDKSFFKIKLDVIPVEE